MSAKNEIESVLANEKRAWDAKDIDLLMSVWHEDMVFIWPSHPKNHNPMDWVLPMGRFDDTRWRESWQGLFDYYNLVHNNRTTQVIKVSEEMDGGFAVVDIDTLWENKETGERDHWFGRTCKTFTKLKSGEWKLIHQIGVLDYTNLD